MRSVLVHCIDLGPRSHWGRHHGDGFGVDMNVAAVSCDLSEIARSRY